MSLLLGIDLGTSYYKLGLFDRGGALRGLGRVAVAVSAGDDGRVELPVEDFWALLRRGLGEALAAAGAGVEDIAGVSYSSQANTFLLLDGEGRALTPLVLWTDQRSKPLDPELQAFGGASEFAARTGMVALAAECAPVKCRWFARRTPEVWAQVQFVMTLSDYLGFVLTGQRVGDASTAALTGLYDVSRRSWWPAALERFGLEERRLSTAAMPGTPCGVTSAAAGMALGLPSGVPFAVGALDHHAAALGAGIGSFVDVSLSTGTVLAALSLTDRVSPGPGCIHGPHYTGGGYYRLAFDPDGAGQLEEFRRERLPDGSIDDLLREAEECDHRPDSARRDGGLGAAVGELLRRLAASHRPLLESAANGRRVRRVAATGGMARSPYFLQLLADALGVPVLAVASSERACLGAAIFASVAARLWPDVETAAAGMAGRAREFEPRA